MARQRPEPGDYTMAAPTWAPPSGDAPAPQPAPAAGRPRRNNVLSGTVEAAAAALEALMAALGLILVRPGNEGQGTVTHGRRDARLCPAGTPEQGRDEERDGAADHASGVAEAGSAPGGMAGQTWQAVMLEEAGLRPLGESRPADPPGGPGTTPTGTGGHQYGGTEKLPWMIDGSYIGGYGPASIAPAPTPIDQDQKPFYAPPQGWDLRDPRAHRWLPTQYVEDQRPALVALVQRVVDAPTRHLLERVYAEPLFGYGARQWRQVAGAGVHNREIVWAVHRRLGALMGDIFGFPPAELAFTPFLPNNMIARYDWDANRTYVTERLLGGAYADLMETLAFEQARAHQRALLAALPGGGLSGDAEALARVLAYERANGLTRRVFGTVGGYHAFYVSYCVGYLAQALREPGAP